jgi:hypothetical protein
MTRKGGTTMTLFHCVFGGRAPISCRVHEIDAQMYQSLPNLFAVCLVNSDRRSRHVAAGFLVKTSLSESDPQFEDALADVTTSIDELKRLLTARSMLMPAHLTVSDASPLIEEEMMSVLARQRLRLVHWNN